MWKGNRLRNYREMRGLSRRDLAEKTGISEQTIFRYETDRREPTVDKLVKIADALGVSPIVFIN